MLVWLCVLVDGPTVTLPYITFAGVVDTHTLIVNHLMRQSFVPKDEYIHDVLLLFLGTIISTNKDNA